MNPNTGRRPSVGETPIDIQFRNGQTKRDVKADQYRWKPWDWGESDWDIARWQYSGITTPQKDIAA